MLVAAVLATVPACVPMPGPAFEPTPAARTAERPQLIETALLRGRLVGAEAEADRLAAEAAALEARAAALRARAAALGGPVVAPERRPRLLEAAGAAGG